MSNNGKKVNPADLVGTKEAAEILGVERPRIGRWIQLGIMPKPVARVTATPLWLKADIEKLKKDREGLRRKPPVKAAKARKKRAAAKA